MMQQTPLGQAGQSIWDLPERGSRGPKARQDRTAAAAAAVRIADAHGMTAVTMRRVAGELGLATMSLYTYVPTKDHLAQLMIDYVAAEYVYRDDLLPREGVLALAGQAREIARRHPWLASLMQRPMAPGPNGLRYLDYFLGLLATSSLDTGAKLEVIGLISGFATLYGVMQAALAGERGPAAHTAAGTQAEPATATPATPAPANPTAANPAGTNLAADLARAAAVGHYPHLATALAVAGPPRGDHDVFASAVSRLVDLAFPPT